MSLSGISYFLILEFFHTEWFRGTYLKSKTFFWNKSYVAELILNKISLKAASKSQMSISQGTNK